MNRFLLLIAAICLAHAVSALPPRPVQPKPQRLPGPPKPRPKAPAAPKATLIQPLGILEPQPILKTPEHVSSVTSSSDGKRLVALTAKTLVIWDWQAQKVLFGTEHYLPARPFVAAQANVVSFLTQPDFSTLPRDLSRKLWAWPWSARNIQTGKARRPLRFNGNSEAKFHHAAISPNGRWIAVVDEPPGKQPPHPDMEVAVTDTTSGRVVHRLKPVYVLPRTKYHGRPGHVWGICFTNSSKGLVAVTSDGAVTVWELARGRQIAEFRVPEQRGRFSSA